MSESSNALDGLSPERRALYEMMLKERRTTRTERARIARRAPGADRIPLSFAQQRLWFLDQLEPGNPFYNLATAVHLAGPLDPAVLGRALSEVVRRHEALRTRLVATEGEAWQVVAPPEPLHLVPVELADDGEERDQAVRRFVRDEARRPFDLAHDLLLRARLLRLGPQEHVAVLSVHHVASDLWSMGVLVREVAALYQAFAQAQPSPLPEPPIQYADYALWQREWLQGDVLAAQLDYWRRQLAGAPPVFELPPDRRRPAVQTFAGARLRLHLPAELVTALREAGRREGATLFMTLLAAFDLLLFRHNGSPDVVVGTDVANRRRGETEELIGFFVNQVVLRTDLSGDPEFLELLRRVRGVTLDAYTHQDLPFDKLVEALNPARDLGHTPLFQVKFLLQNAPVEAVDLPALRFTRIDPDVETSRFDLVMSLNETGDEVRGLIEYNKDLYDEASLTRLAGQYRVLLESIAAEPRRRLSQLDCLAPGERRQVLVDWARVDGAPVERCVQVAFERQVERTPDAPAVAGGGQRLTYRELNRRANQLAHHLRALGVRPGIVVALCHERTPDMIVGLLGILKSGGAYLPLDARYPRARLAQMMEDAQPAVIVTQQSVESSLPAHWAQVVCLDADGEALARLSDADPVTRPPLEALAYVVYTSGSTGRPKGVMVSHAALASRVAALTQVYGITSDDVLLQFYSVGFDAAGQEIYPALVSGARLEMHLDPAQALPRELLADCEQRGVTVLNAAPAYWRQILEEVQASGRPIPSWIRAMLVGGEAVDADSVAAWMRLNPGGAPFYNAYGPAEATIACTVYDAPRRPAELESFTRLSIGRPLPDTGIYILDDALQPVPVAVAGELWVGGGGLAWGYFNRPDQTAERFVPDPFGPEPGGRLYRTGDLARYLPDGSLDFLGRADDQVKIRAFRVELGEVESVLREHPAVRAAAAVMRPDATGSARLVAYWTPAGQAGAQELERFMRERLPEYMVPTAFVALEELPLSPNGKVDRRALPAPDASAVAQAEFRPPRTPIEQRLAAIWSQTLGVERIGLDDNFFALGGDSIRSIQVLARAEREGLRFTVQQLFQQQTIAQLAAVLQEPEPQADAPGVAPFGLLSADDRGRLPDGLDDAYPLTMAQAGMAFHSEFSSNVYHSIASLHLRGALEVDALREALRALTRRHPVLRTSFALTGFSEPLQRVQSEAEPRLDVLDLGALPAPEQEQALEAWLETEKARRFVWDECPLARFTVHRRGPDTFQFTLAAPHAILDGWSDGLLFTELFGRYRRLLRGEPAPDSAPPGATYREFVALERAALGAQPCRDYWRDRLAGAPDSTLPRWSVARPADTPRHVTRRHVVPPAVAEGLASLARRAGVPLKSVLLGAHMRVLGLLTGRSDVVGGLVSNGRQEGADGDRVLGLFLNTLPFRLQLGGGSWLDLAQRAFEAERELLPFRRYPLAQIQRDLGQRALFETYFDYTHFHVYEGVESEGEISVLDSRGNAVTNYTFGAFFNKATGSSTLSVLLLADLDELCLEQFDQIEGYYARTLAAMAADGDGRHDASRLLDATERRRLLVEWSGTPAPVEDEACFPDLFARQVALHPERVAVSDGVEELTYAGLNGRSNQLARYLRGSGIGAESRVALLAERSVDLLVAVLGIQKAGAAYVPLDPSYPRERVGLILEGARADLVLTQERLAGLLPHGAARRVYLDADRDIVEAESAADVERRWSAGQLAYVIFTSGSTGRPKGVSVEQRALRHLVEALRREVYAGLGEGALSVSLNGPLCFDTSVKQWAQLAWGHRVEIVPEALRLDVPGLTQWLAQRRVDVFDCTPSQLRALIDGGWADAGARRPRAVLVGGEALDAPLWSRLAQVEGTRFFNLYGPTECTVDSTASVVVGERPVLGRPLPNVRVYALDEHLEPVPVGVKGELHVGGAGVARGYFGDASATAARFVPDPYGGEAGARLYRTGDVARYLPDGRLEYVGRNDDQVKVRGYRVELGEIEAVLRSHADVRECALVLREDERGESRLVAYVAARRERSPVVEGRPRYRLPNELGVADLNRNETDHLYREVFERGAYSRHGVDVRDGDVVLDVGANIGLFTLYAHLRGQDVTVHSFEPNPEIHAALRLNAELHGVRGQRHPFGLWRAPGRETYTYYPKFSQLSGLYADVEADKEVVRSFIRNQNRRAGETAQGSGAQALVEEVLDERFERREFEVELRSLSQVLREEGLERVGFLKINVEKSELDVLLGIEDADWARIERIVLELHDIDGRLEQVQALLERHGYEVGVEHDWSLEATSGTNYYLYARRRDTAPVAPAAARLDAPPALRLLEAAELREHVRARLPEYMLPAAVVFLERLPLTANGKLDRRALPDPDSAAERDGGERLEPRTAMERLVARVWSDVLGQERLDVRDNFFDLGGHSLSAIQVVSRLRAALRAPVDLHLLFQAPTVEGLATLLEGVEGRSAAATAPPIRPVPRDGDLPLSFAQQRLWFLDRLAPGGFAYNVPASLRLVGRLDVDALERAFGEIVRRHEVLRTTFAEVDGEPVQRIAPAPPTKFTRRDLGDLAEAEREAEARRFVNEAARTPFDLVQGPLFHLALLRLGAEDHVVVFTLHHVVADGWSNGILMGELATLYEAFAAGAPSPLPEPGLQYADYAVWQRQWLTGDALETELQYWRRTLREAEPLRLGGERPRGAAEAAFAGARHTFVVERAVSEALNALGREEQATPFMTLLAAFKALLYRDTGQDDVVVGTAAAGRSREETEGLVGFFINMLALRTDLSGNPTFRELLRRVRAVTLGAFAHQDVPFEKVVEALQPLRARQAAPLFQVAFGLQNAPFPETEARGLKLQPFGPDHEAVRYDLTVWMREGPEGLRGAWTYNKHLFDARGIEAMQRRYVTLLQDVAARPDARLDELHTLSEADERRRRAGDRALLLGAKPVAVRAPGEPNA